MDLLSIRFAGMIVSEDISRAFRHTYFPTLGAIFYAFLMINNHLIVFQVDRLCRAHLDAHPTSDTPYLAELLDLFPRILGAARDPNPDISRNELDNLLRAGTDTGPTADTGHRIHFREVVNHGDGVEGTGLSTLPKAHAGILTPLRAPKGQISTGT